MASILNSSCMSRCLYLEHTNFILFLHVLHHIKSDITCNWSTTVIPYPCEKRAHEQCTLYWIQAGDWGMDHITVMVKRESAPR